MFYIYFIFKIFFFFFLPIYSLNLKRAKPIFSLSTLIQSVWIVYVAFLTYIPFFYYYQQNELNIQHLIPDYIFLVILFIFFILPIIYFNLLRFIFNKFRMFLKASGTLLLIISSIIIFGVDWYNHSKRMELEKICYLHHSSSNEKLMCCLQAEYIWNEGFSFLNEAPEGCSKFMNWNE